jgi:hypothetical protein
MVKKISPITQHESDLEKYAKFQNWPKNKGPIAALGCKDYPDWTDHMEIIKDDDGGITYRSHPYWISVDDLVDFQKLKEAGFHVTIGGCSPYNNNAVLIEIFEKGKGSVVPIIFNERPAGSRVV